MCRMSDRGSAYEGPPCRHLPPWQQCDIKLCCQLLAGSQARASRLATLFLDYSACCLPTPAPQPSQCWSCPIASWPLAAAVPPFPSSPALPGLSVHLRLDHG